MYNSNHGHLLRNIVLFARMLRSAGINITPAQILDLAAALNYIDLRQRGDVKDAARTILINRLEYMSFFDRVFSPI